MLVQTLQNEIWNRFLKEYLTTQQRRVKWVQPKENLKVGDVVILKEHQTHPLDWPLGRVVKCYPDEKGTVRKVDLISKTKTNIHRAVNKLIPMLTEEDEKKIPDKRKTRSMSPISLMSIFLMTFVCLTLAVKATVVKEISHDIYIRRLQENVSVKLLDIKFLLKTNVNVSNDLQQMEVELEKFNVFCISSMEKKSKNISIQCHERHTFLSKEFQITKSYIMGSYGKSRIQRGLFSKLTFEGLKKVAPYVAMSAAMGWQEYEKRIINFGSMWSKNSIKLLLFYST